MAIDLITAGTAFAASSSVTCYAYYPATVTTGQPLVLQINVRDTTTTPTVSASWILFAGPDSTLTNRQFLYFRLGTTTFSGTSATVLFGASAVTKQTRIYGFSGINPTATSYYAGQYMTSSTATMTCGEATATAASYTCLAVACYHVSDDNDVGNFQSATYNWTKKYQSSTTLGSDGTIGVQVLTVTAPPVTITSASYNMGSSDAWGVRTFLFQGSSTIPAAAAGIQPFYWYQFQLASS